MAQITLTINDLHVDRIRDAIAGRGNVPVEDIDINSVRNLLRDYLILYVRSWETDEQILVAQQAVQDIGVN